MTVRELELTLAIVVDMDAVVAVGTDAVVAVFVCLTSNVVAMSFIEMSKRGSDWFSKNGVAREGATREVVGLVLSNGLKSEDLVALEKERPAQAVALAGVTPNGSAGKTLGHDLKKMSEELGYSEETVGTLKRKLKATSRKPSYEADYIETYRNLKEAYAEMKQDMNSLEKDPSPANFAEKSTKYRKLSRKDRNGTDVWMNKEAPRRLQEILDEK